MSRRRTLSCHSLLGLAGLLLFSPAAPGQDKKPEPKGPPKVSVVVPLGAAPRAATKLTIRGIKLDGATGVRFQDARVAVKLLSKSKVSLSDKQDPARVGNTQVEAEVTLPAGLPSTPLSFVVVTPQGDTAAHDLLVESAVPVVAEKEPNDSFRQAQPIQVPQVVEGAVSHPQDVDVFRFEGQAGRRLVVEVLAARYGSSLDSLLTLYDAEGREVAASDDSGGSPDSRLEVTLPRTGLYYLCLADANDQGGPTHVYRLKVQGAP